MNLPHSECILSFEKRRVGIFLREVAATHNDIMCPDVLLFATEAEYAWQNCLRSQVNPFLFKDFSWGVPDPRAVVAKI